MSADLRLPSRDTRGTVILISGDRRAGKTTVLLTVRESAIRAGRGVGGVLSVARFEESGKVGIDVMDAATGRTMPLATIGEVTGGADDVRIGHYTFDPDALAAGLRYAEAGRGADVFFVDELGPLELQRGAGWVAVIDMIRARDFGVALVTIRPELLDHAREKMALPPDALLILVDAANRDAVAAQLANWITGIEP
jgi:nucleoside-triphosphatase THEP1